MPLLAARAIVGEVFVVAEVNGAMKSSDVFS